MLTHTSRWSHAAGNQVVPSRWQATGRGNIEAGVPRHEDELRAEQNLTKRSAPLVLARKASRAVDGLAAFGPLHGSLQSWTSACCYPPATSTSAETRDHTEIHPTTRSWR